MSMILNVVNVARRFYLVMERHATTFSTIRYNLHGLGRIVSSHVRSCVQDVTSRWLGLHLRPTAVRVRNVKVNYAAVLSRIAVRV